MQTDYSSGNHTPITNRLTDNLPSMKTVATHAPKVFFAGAYLTSKIIAGIPTAATYLYNHSPLDTLGKGTTRFAFHEESPLSLRSQDIISNMPTDTIKLSKHQKEIANGLKDSLSNDIKEGMEKLLERFDTSKWSNKISPSYKDLSPAQKKALDVIKFHQLQEHLNALNKCNKGNELASANTAYSEAGLDYMEAHTGEVLAKSLSYLDAEVLKAMGSISLPVNGKMVPYSIKTDTLTPDTSQGLGSEKSNLPFITLTPPPDSGAEPWLVIRGTNPNVIGKGLDKQSREDALESVIADTIDKQGMATAPINNAFDKLIGITNKLHEETGKPVNMAGHSLGGWSVQYLAVSLEAEKKNPESEHPAVTAKLGTVYGYNSPGVSRGTKEIHKGLEEKEDAPNLVNFNKVGDVVPNVGRCLIGKHFRVKGKDNIFHLAHRQIDSHIKHSLQENDIEAEEKKGARHLSEGVRRHLAGSAARMGLKIARKMGNETLAPWATP